MFRLKVLLAATPDFQFSTVPSVVWVDPGKFVLHHDWSTPLFVTLPFCVLPPMRVGLGAVPKAQTL